MILQFAGSLVAILLLAWLAGKLGLGGAPKLDSDDAVRQAAEQADDGYTPVSIARDSTGRAALARDAANKIMVLRPHGSHIAGRILGAGASARLWQDRGYTTLEVDCGERRFGAVFLDIENPDTWVEAINRLSGISDA